MRTKIADEMITMAEHSPDAPELAQEHTLNTGDRVMLALKGGPVVFPTENVERSEMTLGAANKWSRHAVRSVVDEGWQIEPHAVGSGIESGLMTEDGIWGPAWILISVSGSIVEQDAPNTALISLKSNSKEARCAKIHQGNCSRRAKRAS
jgi:hypothetical protein